MPELLTSLVDHMVESIAIYDREGRCLYANHTTARTFGRTLDTLIGRVLWEEFPDAIGNPFHQAFMRVAAGGPAESFDHYYAPFEKWFANRIELRDGCVHVIAREVTEEVRSRRRAEALALTSTVFTRAASFHEAMEGLVEVIGTVFDATCAIRLLSADGAHLERAAHRLQEPLSDELLASTRRLPVDTPFAADAMRTLRATIANRKDAPGGTDDRWSTLVVPLISDGRATGAVFLGRTARRPTFTDDDRLLADELSASIGLFVSRAQQRSEAETLELRLATLADALPALVAFVGADRRYRYVNTGYVRWFGRPREDFIGKPFAEVIGEESAAIIEPYVQRALAGEQFGFRTRLRYPIGVRDVDVQYVPLRDALGTVTGWAALVVDVSTEVKLVEAERVRYEQQLRANERLDRLLGVAARLAVAVDVDEVARAIVEAGVDALGGTMGGMWLRGANGDLERLRTRGMQPRYDDTFARVSVDAPGPLSEAVRTATPVWVRSRAEYAERYRGYEEAHRRDDAPPLSFGCLPIFDAGQVIGALMIAFDDEPRLDTDERAFLEILASHAGEALHRARLLAELRDLSETREAMIQASPAAIILLDSDGIVHTWNPAAERIYGWTAEEAVGRFVPGVDSSKREEFVENLATVLRGSVVSGIQARRLRRDGTWFDAELYAAPVRRSDGRTYCLSMIVDITDRKRLERKRKLVLDAATELARSLDWRKTTARVAQLAVEQELVDACGIDLADTTPVYPTAARAIATGEIERDDDCVSVPMLASDRVIGAFTVRAARRALDDVDLALATELANHTAMAIENARLYAQAEQARHVAEAASHAKDEFLAMLSHELRNPLAPITSALELMHAKHGDSREHAIIERQSRHLARLVDDLLDVSRITRGKLEVKRAHVAVASFVERAVEMTRDLVKQKGHVLAVSIEPDLVVDGDVTRLAQILGNLLSNAARYTEPGGTIDVSGRREGDALVLRVRDSGVGIAPEMLPRIFDSFVQAPQTIARTTGGLGLGLTIVKTLVELHGGSVVAKSEGLGRGTEMEVRLPLASAPAARPSERIAVARPATGRRVLIVDDNQDAAVLLAELLDGYGHMVRTAFDGNEALKIADTHQPEIAILDLGLPQMDGFELARRLRAMHDERGLRLIALSGYNQASDQARSRDAGFAHHLAKPIDLQVLLRLVDESSR